MLHFFKRRVKSAIRWIKDFRKFRRDGGVMYCPLTFCEPSKRFVGKNVMIIGGSSGMGLQIAKDFLAEGAGVMIAARNQQRLKEVVSAMGDPSTLHSITMDIADVNTIQFAINKSSEVLGQIDVFVNCAGVLRGSENPIENYDYVMNINHKGIYHCCRFEGEYLVNNHIRGKIINISSVAGERQLCEPYSLSKVGVNAITRGLAHQLAPHGICVNAIAPGHVPSNIDEHHSQLDIEDNAFCGLHQNKRLIYPQEVSSLVLYLASDIASSIVGQIIGIDGGFKKYEFV